MEDASIYEVELGNGVSMFAVFDGHGGIPFLIQVTKSVNSSSPSLLESLQIYLPIRMASMEKHYSKLFSGWMS